MKRQILSLLFFVVGVMSIGACASQGEPGEPPKEGLSLAVAESEQFAGTFTHDGITLAFDARVVGQEQSLIVTSKGQELVYIESDGVDANTVMRYLGVDVIDTERPGMAQDLINWFSRPEAAALAQLHELINETALMDLPSAELMFKLSTSTDRMVGHYMTNGSNPEAWTNQQPDVQSASNPCGPCFGKCGPGCFAVGSAAYCKAHDCCCRCQGKLKCATTCLVNPKGGCCGTYRRCY